MKQIAEKKGYKVPVGKVLVLRAADKDRKSKGGFQYPVNGYVEAPDWKPTNECGNGLHGALKGEGDGSLFNWNNDAVWQVIEVVESEIIDLQGKVKFKDGNVIYTGNRLIATQIIDKFYKSAIIGCTKSGGDRATITGGYGATITGGNMAALTGGDWAALTGGYRATLTGGDWATITGGDWATITGGYMATITGGNGATITGGYMATITGGDRATLIFRHYDGNRYRFVIGYVGEDGIEANTPYKLNDKNEIEKC